MPGHDARQVLGQKDGKDRKHSQVLADGVDNKLREALGRLKKIQGPQRTVPLLESSCSRPAHPDHGTPGLHWGCDQEEINL